MPTPSTYFPIYLTETYVVFSEDFPIDKEEIEQIIPLLEVEIEKHQDELKARDEYITQFFGKLNDQQKQIIEARYLCRTSLENFPLDWKKQIIASEDGGNCYFQIEIDRETKDVLSFMINGEA